MKKGWWNYNRKEKVLRFARYRYSERINNINEISSNIRYTIANAYDTMNVIDVKIAIAWDIVIMWCCSDISRIMDCRCEFILLFKRTEFIFRRESARKGRYEQTFDSKRTSGNGQTV